LDQNEIFGGERLYDELVNGLYNSKVVLLCISKAYCDSDNCKREFDFTMNHKKKFIPLLFCSDKITEFGCWPVANSILFRLGDAVYINDVFQHLASSVTQNSKPINELVNLIKNKI